MILDNTEFFEKVMNIEDEITERKIYYEYLPEMDQQAEYYRACMAYCSIYKPHLCLDLGFYLGYSAWAMGTACKTHRGEIEGIDIVDARKKANQSAPVLKNVSLKILDKPSNCLEIPFDKYDFIFVDIDHKGPMEKKIHKKIIESNYKGLVFYDDININDGMRNFWKSIKNPKMETGWHFSGFGVVGY